MIALDYIWPEFNYTSAKTLLVLSVSSAIGFLLLFLYSSYFKRQERAWNQLLKYAYAHRLSTGEVKLLQVFFKQLGFTIQQNFKLIQEPAELKEKLRDFFETRKTGDPQQYVQILDKMFPPEKSLQDIYGVGDIQVGEYCSVHFADGVYLGHVSKKSGDELLLKIHNWKPSSVSPKEEIILYFYRLELGGFLMSGNIIKARPGGLIFRHDGNVEMKGDEHLMAEIRRPAIIRPMDLDFTENSRVAAPFLDDEGNPIEQESQVSSITCSTEMLSDQGVLIQMREFVEPTILRKYDSWFIELALNADRQIELEGKLFPSRVYGGKYVFKFVDISGEDRRILFQEIRNHKPVKSRLS
jgi:hypothetical protein